MTKKAIMNLLALLATLATFANAASTIAAPKVAEAASAPKVRQLRAGLAKVLQHSGGLPPTLATEARHVDDDAAKALLGSGASDEAGLQKVLTEFAAFQAHLSGRMEKLHSEAEAQTAEHLPSGAIEKAQDMLPGLQDRVSKVLSHLKMDKGPESPGHATVVKAMEQALAQVAGQNAFDRAVALHRALVLAHDFLATRTQELTADRKRLDAEIQEQSAYILFMMLKQRKKLPMKAQIALLKRRQFKGNSYAQKLLNTHSASQPLSEQLLAMLPKAIAEKLASKDAQGPAGSLAAAGSNGRVLIVSSRMKNVVQSMAEGLTKAKDQLQQMLKTDSLDATEKKQAEVIIVGLNEVLNKVASTKDLKSQMDAMDLMQSKLKAWMQNFAKHQ